MVCQAAVVEAKAKKQSLLLKIHLENLCKRRKLLEKAWECIDSAHTATANYLKHNHLLNIQLIRSSGGLEFVGDNPSINCYSEFGLKIYTPKCVLPL